MDEDDCSCSRDSYVLCTDAASPEIPVKETDGKYGSNTRCGEQGFVCAEDRISRLERSLSKTINSLKSKESLIRLQGEQLKKIEDMYKTTLSENENLQYTNKRSSSDLENLKIILKQYEAKEEESKSRTISSKVRSPPNSTSMVMDGSPEMSVTSTSSSGAADTCTQLAVSNSSVMKEIETLQSQLELMKKTRKKSLQIVDEVIAVSSNLKQKFPPIPEQAEIEDNELSTFTDMDAEELCRLCCAENRSNVLTIETEFYNMTESQQMLLEQENALLRRNLEKMKYKYYASDEKLTTVESSMKDYKSEVKHKDQQIVELEKCLESVNKEIACLKTRLVAILKANEDALEQAKTYNNKLESENSRLRNEVEQLRRETKQLKDTLQETQNAKDAVIGTKLNQLECVCKDLVHKVDQSNGQLVQERERTKEALKAQNDRYEQLWGENERTKETLFRLQQENEANLKKMVELSRAARMADELKEKCSQLQMEKEALDSKLFKLTNASRENRELKDEVDSHREEIRKCRQCHKNTEEENDRLKNENNDLKMHLNNLQQQCLEIERERSSKEIGYVGDINDLKSKNEQLNRENTYLNKSLAELKSVETTNAALKETLAQMEKDKINMENLIQALTDKCAKYCEDNETLQDQLRDKEADSAMPTVLLEGIQNKCDRFMQQLQDKENELVACKEYSAKLEENAEMLAKENAELNSKVDTLEKELNSLQEDLENFKLYCQGEAEKMKSSSESLMKNAAIFSEFEETKDKLNHATMQLQECELIKAILEDCVVQAQDYEVVGPEDAATVEKFKEAWLVLMQTYQNKNLEYQQNNEDNEGLYAVIDNLNKERDMLVQSMQEALDLSEQYKRQLRMAYEECDRCRQKHTLNSTNFQQEYEALKKCKEELEHQFVEYHQFTEQMKAQVRADLKKLLDEMSKGDNFSQTYKTCPPKNDDNVLFTEDNGIFDIDPTTQLDVIDDSPVETDSNCSCTIYDETKKSMFDLKCKQMKMQYLIDNLNKQTEKYNVCNKKLISNEEVLSKKIDELEGRKNNLIDKIDGVSSDLKETTTAAAKRPIQSSYIRCNCKQGFICPTTCKGVQRSPTKSKCTCKHCNSQKS